MKITYGEEMNVRLVLRVTKKNFPKNITIGQWISYIKKSVNYKGANSLYVEQGRYSIYLDIMKESKAKSLIKKIQKYENTSKYGKLIREIKIT
jgi:hypothetical protein